MRAAIERVTTNADFILGADVAAFEAEYARYCEAKHCVGLDSGMSALELGMRAMGIGPGDEVITPAGSFIASSSAISFTGATPIWVDVDARTYNIDPDQIEAATASATLRTSRSVSSGYIGRESSRGAADSVTGKVPGRKPRSR